MNTGVQTNFGVTANRFDTEFLQRQSVHVLVQQKDSHRYLATDGSWTDGAEAAAKFQSGSAAVEQIVKRRLARVQLVLTREIRVSEVIPVETVLGR